MQPLQHPHAGFIGSYANQALGTIVFSESNGRLRYRWGVLEGPVEVYNSARNQLRFEQVGNGQGATFQFGDSGRAESVELAGVRFVRKD